MITSSFTTSVGCDYETLVLACNCKILKGVQVTQSANGLITQSLFVYVARKPINEFELLNNNLQTN